MKKECEAASWWWTQQLNRGVAGQSASNNPPLPFETLSSFQKSLQELMEVKYENHWYPHQPDRGHAYRSIMCDKRVIDNLLLVAAKVAHIPLLRERFADTECIMWIDPGCVKVQYSHSPKSPQIIYQAPVTASTSSSNIEEISLSKGKSFSVPNSPTILSIRTKNPLAENNAGVAGSSHAHHSPLLVGRSTPKMNSTGSINTLRASLVNNLYNNYHPERPRSPNHYNNTLFVPNYSTHTNNGYVQYNNSSYNTHNNNNISTAPAGSMYHNMSSSTFNRPSFNNNVFHNNNGFTQGSDSFATVV